MNMEEKQEKEKGNFWLTVASFIVNKRKAIEILFVLAMIYSVLSINKVQVNQDITSYLPADSETRIGLSLMEEQFTTYGSAKVMVSNITYAQAEDLVDDLENIEGVKQIEFDDSKDHFTGADALFSVTFDGTEDEQISKDALEEVKETLDGYDVYVSSSVGEEERSAESLSQDMNIILVLAVVIIFVGLLLSTKAYLQIPVLLITFGVAAVLNMGTNYWFGTISSVTNSIAVVLQLALAIDYAIILCDRFMEVWNNVFTQFEGDGKGGYTELSQKNIDTGMGLERLAVVMQDVDSVFDIDTMKAIRDRVCELSGKKYEVDAMDDVSIRLITDHIRSSTFMISDGIMPSNEGRGYVLRRIIRRAARHGRMLGIDDIFMAELAKTVISESKDGYPELEEKKDFILKVLAQEEEKFAKTIDQGLAILEEMEKEMIASGSKVLSGDNAFKLYDTYGFPMDLTSEILEEKGFTIDEDGFKKAMEVQRTTARKNRKTTNYMGADATVYDEIDPSVTTEFVGYDKLETASTVTVLTSETEIVEALSDGEIGTIIVEETPFYATMGGQQGDKGVIYTADGTFKVEDTIKLLGGKVGHVGKMTSGMIKSGDKVT